MFETFNTPKFYLANAPLLSTLSMGKETSIIVVSQIIFIIIFY